MPRTASLLLSRLACQLLLLWFQRLCRGQACSGLVKRGLSPFHQVSLPLQVHLCRFPPVLFPFSTVRMNRLFSKLNHPVDSCARSFFIPRSEKPCDFHSHLVSSSTGHRDQ